MQIAVVSLFPEMVRTVAEHGVVGRAIERQLAALRIENPRDYATDTHRTVDDRPYGGGSGMVMTPEPLAAAIRQAQARSPHATTVLLSPQGRRFDHRALRGGARRAQGCGDLPALNRAQALVSSAGTTNNAPPRPA